MKELEVELFNDAILGINTTKDLDSMRAQLLETLCFFIPCSAAVFYLADKERHYSLCQPIGYGASEETWNQYVTNFQMEDRCRWGHYIKESSVFRLTDFLDDEIKRNSLLWKTVYEPERIRFLTTLTIVHQEIFLGIITIFRREHESEFSQEELWKLKLFAKHLEVRLLSEETKAYEMVNRSPEGNIPLPSYESLLNTYRLTLREIDVLYAILQGLKKEDICEKLFISPNTLKRHTVNIYKKMNINSLRELLQLLQGNSA